jgi:hypothetical protein
MGLSSTASGNFSTASRRVQQRHGVERSAFGNGSSATGAPNSGYYGVSAGAAWTLN